MTDQEKQTQKAFERVEEELGALHDSFHQLMPAFEKAGRILRKLADYAPIPVEGKVE